jgi:DNA repair protein RecO (recombination protein O)
MLISGEAVIVAVRGHGESGAIARALTAQHGLLAGYVRGGRSRRLRPVLQPANLVAGEWRARTEDQLPQLSVELIHSRAPLFGEPLPAAALDWVTALTAAALPEGHPYPAVHAAFTGVIEAIEAAPAARGWAMALVRYELLMLAELGFGLALDRCAVTGASDDLAWVSPRSGAAVSRAAGEAYADRLLPFPPLAAAGAADWPAILAGLRTPGHFIARDLLSGRAADALAARTRLVDRLKRAVA